MKMTFNWIKQLPGNYQGTSGKKPVPWLPHHRAAGALLEPELPHLPGGMRGAHTQPRRGWEEHSPCSQGEHE